MRIRLDKLFLSAGLALAVIATTIPVGAATNNFYQGSQGYSADYIARDVQTKAGTVTNNGANVTITANALGTAELGNKITLNDTDTAKAKLTLYNSDNGFTESTQYEVPSSITTTQGFTYALSKSVTVTGDTNGTPAVTEEEVTTPAVAAIKTARDAAVTEAIAELNALGIGKFEKDTSETSATTTPTPGTGSYIVGVKYTAPEKTASTDYGSVGYALSSDTTIPLSVSSVDNDSKATITATFTINYNHTITDLSAVNATYKINEVVPENSAGKQYTLLKVSTDGTIEEVKTVFGASEASNATADVTDLSSAYYLVTKTVSTSDKLTVSAEDDETYTGVISQIGTVTGTAAEKLAEAIEANAAKLVAYLDVAAFKTDDQDETKLDETPYELTFKIAVPADVDTTGLVFKVLRYHGSSVDVLDTTVKDGYIYFTSDKFSSYALVTVAAADTTEEETNNETESATEAGTETTTAGGTSTTSKTSSSGTADNSMMPLFMTTLLLALCAGSLAIYKEKKTN